jgi:hypothetical protein
MALHHALHSAPPNRTPRRANPREEHRDPAALQPRPRPYHPAETAAADGSTARERPRGTPTASAPTEQQTHRCTLRRPPPTQPPPEAGARAEEDLRDVPLRQKQACRRVETRRMQRTTRTTLPRALAAPAFGSRAGATSARPPSLEFCPSHEDDVVPREAGYHLARRRMARGRSDACRLGRRWGYGDERQGVGPAVPSRSVVLLSRSCRVRRSRRARIT